MSSTTAEHLLELPFDQYQRYRVAAELIDVLGVSSAGPILDLGGGRGLAEAFLPDHETVLVEAGNGTGPHALAPGTALPFGDRSFAAALSLDTVEHLDAASRRELLAELQRVSDVVVVSAPFAHPSVALAESALHEFVVQRFGTHFPSPGESSHDGLPDLQETVDALAGGGWATATLPSGYLPHWLAGMLLQHELLANGMPELPRLNAFYNANVSTSDCREPSYRHVVIAARELPAEQLTSAAEALRSDADNAEGELSMQVLTAAVLAHGLGGGLYPSDPRELRAEVERLTREVMSRDREIAELRERNGALHAELQSTRDAVLREARRSISSVVLQRASDWRARRQS